MSRLLKQPRPFTQLTYFFIMLGNSYHKAKYLTYPSRIRFNITKKNREMYDALLRKAFKTIK